MSNDNIILPTSTATLQGYLYNKTEAESGIANNDYLFVMGNNTSQLKKMTINHVQDGIQPASTSSQGLMSADDKIFLNSLKGNSSATPPTPGIIDQIKTSINNLNNTINGTDNTDGLSTIVGDLQAIAIPLGDNNKDDDVHVGTITEEKYNQFNSICSSAARLDGSTWKDGYMSGAQAEKLSNLTQLKNISTISYRKYYNQQNYTQGAISLASTRDRLVIDAGSQKAISLAYSPSSISGAQDGQKQHILSITLNDASSISHGLLKATDFKNISKLGTDLCNVLRTNLVSIDNHTYDLNDALFSSILTFSGTLNSIQNGPTDLSINYPWSLVTLKDIWGQYKPQILYSYNKIYFRYYDEHNNFTTDWKEIKFRKVPSFIGVQRRDSNGSYTILDTSQTGDPICGYYKDDAHIIVDFGFKPEYNMTSGTEYQLTADNSFPSPPHRSIPLNFIYNLDTIAGTAYIDASRKCLIVRPSINISANSQAIFISGQYIIGSID